MYGNCFALAQIEKLMKLEKGNTKLIFNGDFNWFNIDDESFRQVNEFVLKHIAIRGNVEEEIMKLGQKDLDVGCGCSYPSYVR